MKFCPRCKENLPLASFANNKAKKDGKASQCRECKKSLQADWYKKNTKTHKIKIRQNEFSYREENRLKIIEFLKLNPCVICGESDPIVLEFDHLNNKKSAISSLMKRSWKTIEKEMQKCQVLCANCHRRKTAKQLGWYRWVQSFNGEASGS